MNGTLGRREEMKPTDEMIAAAVKDCDRELMEQLPDPKDCHHEFSPEFEEKMQKLLNDQ